MSRDVAHRMKSARLFLLIFHGDAPKNFGERLRFVMRLVERAAARERGESAGDFFSSHGFRNRTAPCRLNSVLKVFLTVPKLFV